MNNKVSGELSPHTQLQIAESIQAIQVLLPFLVELSTTESKHMVHMEGGRVDFVRKALLFASTNDNLRPGFLELIEMEKDLNLCMALDETIVLVEKLHKQLIDTRSLAGNEAYLAALEVYDATKRASAKGIEGATTALEELRLMFEANGKFGKADSNTFKS